MAKRSRKKSKDSNKDRIPSKVVRLKKKKLGEVDDPANVFRMAMLETRQVALENKRAFLQIHYTTQMQALQQKLANETLELDNEIAAVKRSSAEQVQYLEAKHGIALKDFTYNDKTGVLTKRNLKKEMTGKKEKEDV